MTQEHPTALALLSGSPIKFYGNPTDPGEHTRTNAAKAVFTVLTGGKSLLYHGNLKGTDWEIRAMHAGLSPVPSLGDQPGPAGATLRYGTVLFSAQQHPEWYAQLHRQIEQTCQALRREADLTAGTDCGTRENLNTQIEQALNRAYDDLPADHPLRIQDTRGPLSDAERALEQRLRSEAGQRWAQLELTAYGLQLADERLKGPIPPVLSARAYLLSR